MNNDENTLSALELDILQEIMNISFGKAAADLAEVIDIFITLNSPKINVVKVPELPDFISKEINQLEYCSLVEQQYVGELMGVAFLVFPHGSEKEFLSYFQDQDVESLQSDIVIDLEKEVLMEVGNILIGACIGKIFELIDGFVTYKPPRVIIGQNFKEDYLYNAFSKDDSAIIMKTSFTFEDRNVSGYLFLINDKITIARLKIALANFWKKHVGPEANI